MRLPLRAGLIFFGVVTAALGTAVTARPTHLLTLGEATTPTNSATAVNQ